MAYICPKDGKCLKCEHYRLDPEDRRFACFVKQDEERERNNIRERIARFRQNKMH